jgi:spore coat protein A, manganese oxidase
MAVTRRRLLGLAAGTGAAAAVGVAVPWLSSPAESGRLLPSEIPLPDPFRTPLPIPPVLAPQEVGGVDRYDLTHRPARVELIRGLTTEIWGYDGRFPGPTIVSRRGRPVVVRHRNQLPVASVVHLHGGHTPAESDGYPTDLILPDGADSLVGTSHHRHHDPQAVTTRAFRDYAYPMSQRAATLWYHDHRMDFTGPGVWRGLAGFHLVHDDEEEALPLPAGDRDIPLMIADRSFAADGSMRYPSIDPSHQGVPGVEEGFRQGVLGDVILVNGAPWPFHEVPAARHRLRLLNASNTRRYRLSLEPSPKGGAGLVQIGSDGGLLERPLGHDSVDIAPGERFDLVVDFGRYAPGQAVKLVNRLGSESSRDVMQFRVGKRVTDDSAVPERLSTIEPLQVGRATVTRDFVFRNAEDHTWEINGRHFDPARMDATVPLGETEVWRFTTDFHHPVHLHLEHFQVLKRNSEGRGPFDSGWKDTIDLRPAERVAVAVRFTDHPGRYVFHCHNLEHEDMAMMANMRVVSG